METSKNLDNTGQKGLLRRDIPTQNGNVVLIRDAIRHIENQSYQNHIRSFGFNANSLNKLLDGTHPIWATKPVEEGYYPKEKPVEYISVRNWTTTDGKRFEATLVTEVSKPSKMRFLWPKPQYIGFEAILMQKGSVTYNVLNDFNHTDNTYMEEGTPAMLKPGDLLIVPRGVGRQLSEVMLGSEYLYIGDPWTEADTVILTYVGKPSQV